VTVSRLVLIHSRKKNAEDAIRQLRKVSADIEALSWTYGVVANSNTAARAALEVGLGYKGITEKGQDDKRSFWLHGWTQQDTLLHGWNKKMFPDRQ
jgi:hypothetical protein